MAAVKFLGAGWSLTRATLGELFRNLGAENEPVDLRRDTLPLLQDR